MSLLIRSLFSLSALYSVAHTSQVLVSELAVKAKKGRAKAGAGKTCTPLIVNTAAWTRMLRYCCAATGRNES
jgi:hypothetical protein